MNPDKFLVSKRPKLGSITEHPRVEFEEYERRLRPLQSTLRFVQQAYLGTREHAVVVLEGWDTAGKG
jgi:polyphosphate kinase 2 (PPK2 family)